MRDPKGTRAKAARAATPRVIGNLDALLAEIHRQASQQVLELEHTARAEADQRLAEAEREAAAELEVGRRQARKEGAKLRRQLLARGDLDAQRRLLIAREEVLERVWQEAEARLRKLVAEPGYLEVLERLALLAARELRQPQLALAADPGGHPLLNPERLASWSQRAGVAFARSEQAAACWGGLVAQHQRNRYDACFATRLALARELLREEVYRLLRGEGAAAVEVAADASGDAP